MSQARQCPALRMPRSSWRIQSYSMRVAGDVHIIMANAITTFTACLCFHDRKQKVLLHRLRTGRRHLRLHTLRCRNLLGRSRCVHLSSVCEAVLESGAASTDVVLEAVICSDSAADTSRAKRENRDGSPKRDGRGLALDGGASLI